MSDVENIYLTRMQREFIRVYGRERYSQFVQLLLSIADIERIRKEFALSFSQVILWRQIVSLQQSYEVFCNVDSV